MPRQFNAGLMILARGSRGYSQAAFAKILSWSQGKVSKIEHNLLSVEDDEVKQIADGLGYPADLFYQSDTATGYGSCCQYDRKRITTPVRQLNKLHDEINIKRIQVGRLLKGIDLPHEMNYPLFDVDRYGGPVKAAQLLRATWQLPRGKIENLMDVVERAGGVVVMCDFQIPVIDGVSQRTQGLPHLFFLDKSKPVDRLRFTLAHEIGHMVMHAIPSPNAEKEADQFAGEFLMPEKEIAPDFKNVSIATLANLKLKWRASMQALLYRARAIGAIDSGKYKSLYVRISQLGYRKNEPNPLTPERPKMLRWVIDQYLTDRRYSVRELSAASLCREDSFIQEFLDDGPRLKVV